MDPASKILRRDEQCVLGLRELYESYGYKKYKMSRFEGYDLYLENKNFLKNSSIATVTDPKGRLLALKPDITLSIVRNINGASLPQKVYYNENVYAADGESGDIREITQVGLEYIGELDTRALGEVLLLASKTLKGIDSRYCIAISHMGFVSQVLESVGLNTRSKRKLLDLIASKNLHGIKELAASNGLLPEDAQKLCAMVSLGGRIDEAIPRAMEIFGNREPSLCELWTLCGLIKEFGLCDRFVLDFSVINDMKYYNGLVFQGFVSAVPRSVLSGGRYDKLVRLFGKDTSAIGFALEMDLLYEYHYSETTYDCDVLLCYERQIDPVTVLSAQETLTASGKTVIAVCLDEQNDFRYRKKAILDSFGELNYESDD